jgi:hypothetical protein
MSATKLYLNWMGFQNGHLEQMLVERSVRECLVRLPQERGVVLHVNCAVILKRPGQRGHDISSTAHL